MSLSRCELCIEIKLLSDICAGAKFYTIGKEKRLIEDRPEQKTQRTFS